MSPSKASSPGGCPDAASCLRSRLFVAPSVPFGGYGASGLGRGNGVAAVDEYLESKSVWVQLRGGTRDPFTLG
jgi:Aldehyde dehydrogenase family